MTHSVGISFCYLFVKGLCCPDQRIGKSFYAVWVHLHKDKGAINNGDCTCVVG